MYKAPVHHVVVEYRITQISAGCTNIEYLWAKSVQRNFEA